MHPRTAGFGGANSRFHRVQVAPELPNRPSRPLSMARALCHNGCVLPRPEQKEPRMKKLIPSALIVLASSVMVPAALAQDADAGKNSFNKCLACHAIGEDAKNKVGPELNGLDGRKSGTVPDYNYSEANKNSGITWNEANFKEYIKDPKAKVPGTKMFFAGIKNETEVNNLWAYISKFDNDGKTK
jgi:cytochrome c